MKKLLCIAAIFLFLNITGCYTVIWSPGMDFPTADNQNEYNSADSTGYYNESDNYSSNNDNFYFAPYYGSYDPWYNTPWWYSYPPPTVNSDKNKTAKTRNAESDKVRNSGDGRGQSGRSGEIINTPPVSVSGSGSTSSGSSSTDSGANKTSTDNDNKNDNSRQSTNSGSVRNNDGSRNDGGRK
jgi:hypothetical protein